MEQFIFLVDFLSEKIRILHSYVSWGNGLRKQVSSEVFWLVFFDDYGHQSCLGAGCMLWTSPVVILAEFLCALIGFAYHTAHPFIFIVLSGFFFFLMASHVFQVDFKVPL